MAAFSPILFNLQSVDVSQKVLDVKIKFRYTRSDCGGLG